MRTLLDRFSRFVAALDPRVSHRGADIGAVLDRIGFPPTIRVHQGRAVNARGLDLWASQRCGALDVSRPGQPIATALIEALRGQSGQRA